MDKFLLLPICCFLLLINTLHAQNTAQDAAALSPTELPSYEDFKKSPENIKIPVIKVQELHTALSTGKEKFTIIDVRNKEEYDISRLPNAKRIGYNDFSIEKMWMVDRKYKIVLYSSTSAKRALVLAQYLTLMGFTDLHILEGGIIAWKNASYDTYDANKALSDKIHVGEKENVKLLKVGTPVHF